MAEINFKKTMSDDAQLEMMGKYDREFSYRKATGFLKSAIFLVAVSFSIFQVYTALMGALPPTQQRSAHIGFALVLIFLMYPMFKKDNSNKIRWYDVIFIAGSLVVVSYLFINFDTLLMRAGANTAMDMYISIVAVVIVFEATRRVAGPVLVSVASVFLLYAFFGNFIPGFFSHGGYSLKRIATYMWISSEAILGIPISVSASFIFLFLLFAAYLKKTGVGDWLTDLALAVAGGSTGGPAKAAVIASATQGTISGSSVANTVGTGSVTIPLMKSIGYKPEFSAAVEAAASTGGQLMPPVMGAAAFIMTEFTALPYLTIALGATVPAILYFTGIFIMVHLEAQKQGLEGIPKERLPRLAVLAKKAYLSVPIFVIVGMLAMGYTPMRAALFGIFSTIIVGIFHGLIDKDAKFFIKEIIEGLEEGAKSALPVVMACASAGIIVGVVTLTGLGMKFSHGIVELSGGSVVLTMAFTMVASIILGMGMPTTANYIVQATIAAPALVAVGIPILGAHLFVFYFGIIADITPPVALAAFAGSGIAKSNPFQTGVQASKLAFAAYLVPFIFATSPVLILNFEPAYSEILLGSNILTFSVVFITAIMGMFAIGGAMSGYMFTKMNNLIRPFLFLIGIGLVQTNFLFAMISVALFVAIMLYQKKISKNEIVV